MAEVTVAMHRTHLRAHHAVARVLILETWAGSSGRVKLGQPDQLSNLWMEANRGSPETIST